MGVPALRSAVDNLGKVLPGLRKTAIIEGAGHWVQQEAPGAVNALLIEFLRAVT